MFESKLSNNLSKWILDTSKLTKDDLEVLTIINFPRKLGYNDVAQMRIKRMYANGGFIDKSMVTINDITFTVTSKHNAEWYLSRHSLPDNASQVAIDHLQGVMKSKSKQFVYVDGDNMEGLLDLILTKFSSPKPTPSAIVEDKPKVEKKKEDKPKRTRKKYQLSEEEKEKVKDMAFNQSMDLKEMSKAMGVPQATIREYLKTLKNG